MNKPMTLDRIHANAEAILQAYCDLLSLDPANSELANARAAEGGFWIDVDGGEITRGIALTADEIEKAIAERARRELLSLVVFIELKKGAPTFSEEEVSDLRDLVNQISTW